VVDGGSEDGTVEILEEAERTYNLSWRSEPDNGISDAMNKGLSRAAGHYIIFIHADDQLVGPDTLESVRPVIDVGNIDIYSFPVILDHPLKGRLLRKPIPLLWYNHFKFIFLHQGAFVNFRVFEKTGGFREEYKIAMDYDFFYRALQCKASVHFGEFPVAVMGGEGVGTVIDTALQRLEEERRVQIRNERNPLWRVAQSLFAAAYRPYKLAFIRRLNRSYCRN